MHSLKDRAFLSHMIFQRQGKHHFRRVIIRQGWYLIFLIWVSSKYLHSRVHFSHVAVKRMKNARSACRRRNVCDVRNIEIFR